MTGGADDGVFYNGYRPDPDAVMKAGGHARNSIINLKNGILTRGILIETGAARQRAGGRGR